MRTVIIVDDEYYARKGIKQIIQSFGAGYSIIGEAEDSFSALELIKKKRPDIVLTDINMPVMDGIELVKTVVEFAPNSKFIIITGHDEFEYAKKAFKLDIVDFILKPVDKDELLSAMDRASLYIARDVNTAEKEIISYLRRETDGERAARHIGWQTFSLALIQLEASDKISGSYGEISNCIKKMIAEHFDEEYYLLKINSDRLVILTPELKNDCSFFKKIRSAVRKQFKIPMTISIAPICTAKELPGFYLHVKNLMLDRFYQGEGAIINDFSIVKKPLDIKALETMFNSVQIAAKAYDRENTLGKTDELYEMLLHMKCSVDLVMEYSMRLYIFMKCLMEGEQFRFEGLEEYNPVSHSLTLETLWENSKSLLYKSLTMIRDEKSDHGDSSIKKAIFIINKRFNEDISLEYIAKEVYLNQSYLSRKLKETLGISFTKYVTKLRMEEALKLLNKNEKIEDISKQVGFSNYRNFSEAFKQYTGYLPSKYMKIKK